MMKAVSLDRMSPQENYLYNGRRKTISNGEETGRKAPAQSACTGYCGASRCATHIAAAVAKPTNGLAGEGWKVELDIPSILLIRDTTHSMLVEHTITK